MSAAKITLFSFAQWMHLNDKDLFSEMTLPEGIDKDLLTDNILLQGGEFEVVYADPDFMQYAIGSWSRKHYRTFEKWLNALDIEYNPLENYDRDEEWTDETDGEKNTLGRRDSGNTRTFDNSDEEVRDISDETVFDKTTTTENKVSAYDSSTYQNAAQDTVDEDGTITVNGTGTNTFNHTGTIDDKYGEGFSSKDTDETTVTHKGRIHGNIGVTTSQQMLQAELDISTWNIYEHITDLFLSEFVILIYT